MSYRGNKKKPEPTTTTVTSAGKRAVALAIACSGGITEGIANEGSGVGCPRFSQVNGLNPSQLSPHVGGRIVRPLRLLTGLRFAFGTRISNIVKVQLWQ